MSSSAQDSSFKGNEFNPSITGMVKSLRRGKSSDKRIFDMTRRCRLSSEVNADSDKTKMLTICIVIACLFLFSLATIFIVPTVQAFNLSLWVGIGISLPISILLGVILNKLTSKKNEIKLENKLFKGVFSDQAIKKSLVKDGVSMGVYRKDPSIVVESDARQEIIASGDLQKRREDIHNSFWPSYRLPYMDMSIRVSNPKGRKLESELGLEAGLSLNLSRQVEGESGINLSEKNMKEFLDNVVKFKLDKMKAVENSTDVAAKLGLKMSFDELIRQKSCLTDFMKPTDAAKIQALNSDLEMSMAAFCGSANRLKGLYSKLNGLFKDNKFKIIGLQLLENFSEVESDFENFKQEMELFFNQLDFVKSELPKAFDDIYGFDGDEEALLQKRIALEVLGRKQAIVDLKILVEKAKGWEKRFNGLNCGLIDQVKSKILLVDKEIKEINKDQSFVEKQLFEEIISLVLNAKIMGFVTTSNEAGEIISSVEDRVKLLGKFDISALMLKLLSIKKNPLTKPEMSEIFEFVTLTAVNENQELIQMDIFEFEKLSEQNQLDYLIDIYGIDAGDLSFDDGTNSSDYSERDNCILGLLNRFSTIQDSFDFVKEKSLEKAKYLLEKAKDGCATKEDGLLSNLMKRKEALEKGLYKLESLFGELVSIASSKKLKDNTEAYKNSLVLLSLVKGSVSREQIESLSELEDLCEEDLFVNVDDEAVKGRISKIKEELVSVSKQLEKGVIEQSINGVYLTNDRLGVDISEKIKQRSKLGFKKLLTKQNVLLFVQLLVVDLILSLAIFLLSYYLPGSHVLWIASGVMASVKIVSMVVFGILTSKLKENRDYLVMYGNMDMIGCNPSSIVPTTEEEKRLQDIVVKYGLDGAEVSQAKLRAGINVDDVKKGKFNRFVSLLKKSLNVKDAKSKLDPFRNLEKMLLRQSVIEEDLASLKDAKDLMFKTAFEKSGNVGYVAPTSKKEHFFITKYIPKEQRDKVKELNVAIVKEEFKLFNLNQELKVNVEILEDRADSLKNDLEMIDELILEEKNEKKLVKFADLKLNKLLNRNKILQILFLSDKPLLKFAVADEKCFVKLQTQFIEQMLVEKAANKKFCLVLSNIKDKLFEYSHDIDACAAKQESFTTSLGKRLLKKGVVEKSLASLKDAKDLLFKTSFEAKRKRAYVAPLDGKESDFIMKYLSKAQAKQVRELNDLISKEKLKMVNIDKELDDEVAILENRVNCLSVDLEMIDELISLETNEDTLVKLAESKINKLLARNEILQFCVLSDNPLLELDFIDEDCFVKGQIKFVEQMLVEKSVNKNFCRVLNDVKALLLDYKNAIGVHGPEHELTVDLKVKTSTKPTDKQEMEKQNQSKMEMIRFVELYKKGYDELSENCKQMQSAFFCIFDLSNVEEKESSGLFESLKEDRNLVSEKELDNLQKVFSNYFIQTLTEYQKKNLAVWVKNFIDLNGLTLTQGLSKDVLKLFIKVLQKYVSDLNIKASEAYESSKQEGLLDRQPSLTRFLDCKVKIKLTTQMIVCFESVVYDDVSDDYVTDDELVGDEVLNDKKLSQERVIRSMVQSFGLKDDATHKVLKDLGVDPTVKETGFIEDKKKRYGYMINLFLLLEESSSVDSVWLKMLRFVA